MNDWGPLHFDNLKALEELVTGESKPYQIRKTQMNKETTFDRVQRLIKAHHALIAIMKEKDTMSEKMSTHDYIGKLTPEMQDTCDATREYFRIIENFILALPGIGSRSFSDRCYSLARTKLEEACMFAIKGIVFEGKEVK